MDSNRVIYSEYVQDKESRKWRLEEKGEATFCQFGCNYEEFETGPGNFTTAIIRLDDGAMKNIPVEHIRFKTSLSAEKDAG